MVPMPSEFYMLVWPAITIALLHTLAGPDHYLPFIALSRSRNWSLKKTALWTVICGCGHVLSSVVIALLASLIGWSLGRIEFLEATRGGVAGWCLLIFGILYTAWGMMKVFKNRRHRHFDVAVDGSVYIYEHRDGEMVMPAERHRVTPWVMFIIFLLGPCEPMIPLLYLPAVQDSWMVMVLLVVVYLFFTLMVMLAMVILGYHGIGLLAGAKLEKYMHVLGGITIFICGAGMVWLKW